MIACGFAVLLGLVPIAPAAGPASDPAPVALAIGETGLVTVPVAIDGRGPFVFLLDTGSSRTVVGGDLASGLALPIVARSVMVTPAGSQSLSVARLDDISVGGARRRGMLASVVPAAQLRAAMSGIDGILGQDFLLDFNYTIDYRGKRLSWGAASHVGDREVRLGLIRHEGRYLVEATQSDQPLRLVPDSGAEDVVIFERRGGLPVTLDSVPDDAQIVSATGWARARATVLHRLELGRTVIRNQRALVVERDEPDAPEVDGLLPLRLFASVSFNATEGFVVFRR